MPGKWRHTQLQREIREFNREFLGLLCAGARPEPVFGLPLGVCQRLWSLDPDQREAIVDTPCLLATFVLQPSHQLPCGVADAPRPILAPARVEAARFFAASLLTWLWHTARQDKLTAALCTGPGQQVVEQLASTGFRDLQRLASGAVYCLEARFCRHPRLWPDLVRAASRADPQLLSATRLSVVQLTLVSRA